MARRNRTDDIKFWWDSKNKRNYFLTDVTDARDRDWYNSDTIVGIVEGRYSDNTSFGSDPGWTILFRWDRKSFPKEARKGIVEWFIRGWSGTIDDSLKSIVEADVIREVMDPILKYD